LTREVNELHIAIVHLVTWQQN